MRGMDKNTGKWIQGVQHLNQSLQTAITTRLGELPMHRDVGLDHGIVDEIMDQNFIEKGILAYELTEALQKTGDNQRVQIQEVENIEINPTAGYLATTIKVTDLENNQAITTTLINQCITEQKDNETQLLNELENTQNTGIEPNESKELDNQIVIMPRTPLPAGTYINLSDKFNQQYAIIGDSIANNKKQAILDNTIDISNNLFNFTDSVIYFDIDIEAGSNITLSANQQQFQTSNVLINYL